MSPYIPSSAATAAAAVAVAARGTYSVFSTLFLLSSTRMALPGMTLPEPFQLLVDLIHGETKARGCLTVCMCARRAPVCASTTSPRRPRPPPLTSPRCAVSRARGCVCGFAYIFRQIGGGGGAVQDGGNDSVWRDRCLGQYLDTYIFDLFNLSCFATGCGCILNCCAKVYYICASSVEEQNALCPLMYRSGGHGKSGPVLVVVGFFCWHTERETKREREIEGEGERERERERESLCRGIG